jgi:hypothetical protein
MMKNFVNLIGLGIIVLLLSSFFMFKGVKVEESSKIKSIGIKEDMILPAPFTQPIEPFSAEMVSYFNEAGGEDSTVLNTYTGEKVILSHNVYDKNNRLDTIYYFLKDRVSGKVEAFEYDKKNNVKVKTVSLDSYENKYFFFYNKRNQLMEEIGFNTGGNAMDTIYWHKFKNKKRLMIEDANLFDEGNVVTKITYNKNGAQANVVWTKKKRVDGKMIDYVNNTVKQYKYNQQGDWVECLSISKVIEDGEKDTFTNLIRREIEYY